MLLAALIIAFSIIKAARILSIRIKQTEHTGAYNFQTLNAPKFEEIKQESEKMLDEASILAEMHMKTRCPVGNFSKNSIRVTEIETTDSISDETISALKENS